MPFPPSESLFLPHLTAFRALVDAYSAEMIRSRTSDDWKTRELPTHGKCASHGIYLHGAGCLICNDLPSETPAEAAPNRTARKTGANA
jgi:hypothetical protein